MRTATMDSIGLPEHRLLSVSRVAKPNKVPCKHYKNKSTTKFIPFSSAEYTSKSVHTGLGHSSSSNRSLASKAHSLNGSLGAEGNQNGSRSPVLILPGFLSNNTTAPQSQYRELADNLIALGHPAAEVLPASTWDWVPTLSGGSFNWYIQRLAEAVQRLHSEHQQQISLVGISAGGWLARIALGSVPYDGQVWGLAPFVHTLITCGTPHQSLEAYPFGRAEESWLVDVPDGKLPASVTTSLRFTNHHYAHADTLKPTRLVCVVGNAVKGERFDVVKVGPKVLMGRLKLGDANDVWFVQSSYQANCGQVEVDGDGVCPVETATVPGAELLVLPDVWHDAAPDKLWYGSREVVEQWDKYLP